MNTNIVVTAVKAWLAQRRMARSARAGGLPGQRKRRQGEGAAPTRRRTPGLLRNALDAGLGIVILKFLVGVIIVLGLTGQLDALLRPLQQFMHGDAPATAPTRGLET